MNDALLGRTIAQRYRLLSRLGSGKTSTVYLARHMVIERLCALKLVHPAFAHRAPQRERFLREAQAVNRINHPNIVEITDYGEASGLVYLVMEYVPGEPLRRALDRGPLGFRRAANIGMQLASALGRAHQTGVIHRNLGPANILIVPETADSDLAKLTDFGVAKLADAATLTAPGFAPGTPGYTAPELRSPSEVDARSDLFSLGAVLYEATTGTLPFDIGDRSPLGDSLAGLSLPPYPRAERLRHRAPDAPPLFEEILMRLLEPNPIDRPRDGFEVYEMLRRVLDQEGPPPSRSARSSRRRRSARAEDDGPISSTLPPPPLEGEEEQEPKTEKAPEGSLDTLAFDQVAPFYTAKLGRLEARRAALGIAADETMDEARRLVSMVSGTAALIAADSSLIELLQTRGRALRAELGEQLDEAARERSRILGWAGCLAERTYDVEARRFSGQHSLPAVEAMVWEQAALEQEEDQVRARAETLFERMTTLNRELDRQNEELERDLMAANASLEGRIAALRALGNEARAALDAAAAHLRKI